MATVLFSLDERVEKIRHFNRMYAHKIGIVSEKIFDSTMSLTELRVLHELSLHKQTTATELSRILDLDGGYLSRILNKFEKDELISKETSLKDARQRKLSLTKRGHKAWDIASAKAAQNVKDMVGNLDEAQQSHLIAAMATIATLLGFE
jgi:DNA-binding MarR family transcriptional regulator